MSNYARSGASGGGISGLGYPAGSGISGGSGYDPSGGLMGAAALISAQGQFLTSQMQSYLMREQVRAAQIANRRQLFDEQQYVRNMTPTAQEKRQRHQQQAVLRSLNNPPLTEIWSGQALNVLLNDLGNEQYGLTSAALRTFNLPLEQSDLSSLNLTRAVRAGNIALVRDGGQLDWPFALAGREFAPAREQIDALRKSAVADLRRSNHIESVTLNDLRGTVSTLEQNIKKRATQLTFSEYRDARRFVDYLNASVKALEQPDVSGALDGTDLLKNVRTVPALVRLMADQGLTFGPALPGQESTYRALHRALASYHAHVHGTANRSATTSVPSDKKARLSGA